MVLTEESNCSIHVQSEIITAVRRVRNGDKRFYVYPIEVEQYNRTGGIRMLLEAIQVKKMYEHTDENLKELALSISRALKMTAENCGSDDNGSGGNADSDNSGSVDGDNNGSGGNADGKDNGNGGTDDSGNSGGNNHGGNDQNKLLNLVVVAVICILIILNIAQYINGRTNEETVVSSGMIEGICGEHGGNNVTWSLNIKEGTLTLSGTGNTDDYSGQPPPWTENAESIEKIVIEEGIVLLGKYIFATCSNLREITFPGSISAINTGAFENCTKLTDVYYPGSGAAWDDLLISDSWNANLTSSHIHVHSNGS